MNNNIIGYYIGFGLEGQKGWYPFQQNVYRASLFVNPNAQSSLIYKKLHLTQINTRFANHYQQSNCSGTISVNSIMVYWCNRCNSAISIIVLQCNSVIDITILQ